MIRLEQDQLAVAQGCKNIIKRGDHLHDPRIKIGGIAGSGKTTVARAILEFCGIQEKNTMCMAYTGQAARRMRQNGLNAYTIHRSLMRPTRKQFVDKVNGPVTRGGIPYMVNEWDYINELPHWAEAILIDEYSFVNSFMEDKIKELAYKKGIPMFCVGDPEQLDPIQGEGRFSIDDLHFFLDKPRRQSLDSPIYRLAMTIREDRPIDPGEFSFLNNKGGITGKGSVIFLNSKPTRDQMVKYYGNLLKYFEAILVVSNNQRNEITDMLRRMIYGIDSFVPTAGEKLICRKNNFNLMIDEDYPLINGTVGYCMRDIAMSDIDMRKRLYMMDFRPMDVKNDYFDSLICDLGYLNEPFQSNKPKDKYNNGNKLEYAYATTVHSSQGMQYNDVAYMERYIPNREQMRKIRYTAVSRAIGSLTWFI